MYPGDFAQSTPNKPAYIMASTGEIVTYKQLDDAANRLANLLRASGFEVGDHIAICMENHPRFFEVIWGCHYAGLIYTACSSRLTSDELSYIINDCGAKGFITSKYKSDQAAEIINDIPQAALRLMVDGTIPGFDSYEQAVSQHSTEPLTERISGMDMLYSSGTTGRPKGVKGVLPRTELTTQNGVANLAQMLFSMTEDAVYLSPAPLYHAAPLRFNLATMFTGATSVIMEHFDAEEYLGYVEKYNITHSQLVPTMFVRMLKLPVEVRERYNLSSLKVAIHAAAPCPVQVKKQMIEWWGPVIHEYYAGTEGNGFVYCNSEMWLAHPGTVGTSIQGVVHICDEEGNEQPQGESGTIFFESQTQFEYHNDPEKTKSSRDPQGRGWSTLGDAFAHRGTDTLFIIVAGVVANDIAAYFVGTAIGRQPLREWISPKKSIEGVIGGTIGTFVIVVLVGMQSTTWNSFGSWILLALVISVMAPLGDLTESMFKRNLDIKDFGTLLSGHGGALDRFDSMLFVLPAVYYLGMVITPWA